MPIRYKWGVSGGKLGPPRQFKDARTKFATRMAQLEGNEWKMRRWSKGKWSKTLHRKEALLRLVKQATAERTDADREAWVFLHVPTSKSFVFREVVVKPKITLPDGAERWHPKLREVYVLAFTEFPEKSELEWWGTENCRRMRNSWSWSMHSYWPPALAIDLGHQWNDLGLQDRLVAFLKSRIDGLHFVTGRMASDHRNHVHVQVGPNRSGTPSCA